MDEEDGIAGRHAVIEHNEYLVEAVKPPCYIQVHVLREIIGADGAPTPHFHKPYHTTLTHLQAKEDPDALFTLLRRCLPFQEWDYVDDSTTDFDPFLYLLKTGEGTESEEDEAWGFADYTERTYVDWQNLEPEQDMRFEVRELQQGMFFARRYNPKKIFTWWFVLKVRA